MNKFRTLVRCILETSHFVKINTWCCKDALEAMLSKKSLVKDQFLASKMNPQMCAGMFFLEFEGV